MAIAATSRPDALKSIAEDLSTDARVVRNLEAIAKDRINGIEVLFNVKLDDQQKALIEKAFGSESRVCVKSCQGAGKTATLVWIAFTALLTLKNCRILITSPSANQLDRVFYAEAMQWKAAMPPWAQEFFEINRSRISIKGKPYQVANLVTASAENEENLQGGHADNYIILADEASGIDEPVFDILLGTLGTGVGRFIMTSNPIRNSGRFYEIFNKEELRKEHGGDWDTLTFTAKGSSQVKDSWVEEMGNFYGTDSDIYKIRVLAEFPRVSEAQFIPTDLVETAMENNADPREYKNLPRVCGIDVARFGSDRTVFTCRQGQKLLDITAYKGLDTMEVAARALDYYKTWMPERMFVDAIGIGAGVFDRCRQMQLPVVEVVVSTKSTEPKMYYNLRAQLWGEMRTWLTNGADIPKDSDLKSQLQSMSYGYNNKLQIQLASKKDIKKLGLDSPDIPDSLALTFAGHTFNYTPKSVKARRVRRTGYRYV